MMLIKILMMGDLECTTDEGVVWGLRDEFKLV